MSRLFVIGNGFDLEHDLPTSYKHHFKKIAEKSEQINYFWDKLMQSETELLVLLGDIPIAQYLKKVADVPYSTLGEYVDLYGYGNATETTINGKTIKVLPMAHPRQIGALGAHSEKWYLAHQEWEANLK